MADQGADSADAYLPLWAIAHGNGVASFDRDLRKLPGSRLEP